MKITIKTLANESINIELELNDTIKKIKEKIQEIKGFQITQQILILGGQLLEDNETLAFYNIDEQVVLNLALKKKVNYDDNLKDCMITFFDEENNKQLEVTEYIKNYLKENQLNVNLIHFDLNINNKANYIYYNKFNIDVIGDFKAINELSILLEYLNKIRCKNIPYIIISSGSSGNDVISI